jgi:hypothetical protein
MAVVEQPPKGGGDVMIRRDCSHTCVHMALLCIYDVHALYATDRSALMAQKRITIYGNSHILFVQYALCGQATGTVRVVLWTMYVLAARDDIM